MTPEEFKETRRKLGLTLSQLAEILDVDARTIRKWEATHGANQRAPNPVAAKVMGWMMAEGRPAEWPEPHQ